MTKLNSTPSLSLPSLQSQLPLPDAKTLLSVLTTTSSRWHTVHFLYRLFSDESLFPPLPRVMDDTGSLHTSPRAPRFPIPIASRRPSPPPRSGRTSREWARVALTRRLPVLRTLPSITGIDDLDKSGMERWYFDAVSIQYHRGPWRTLMLAGLTLEHSGCRC